MTEPVKQKPGETSGEGFENASLPAGHDGGGTAALPADAAPPLRRRRGLAIWSLAAFLLMALAFAQAFIAIAIGRFAGELPPGLSGAFDILAFSALVVAAGLGIAAWLVRTPQTYEWRRLIASLDEAGSRPEAEIFGTGRADILGRVADAAARLRTAEAARFQIEVVSPSGASTFRASPGARTVLAPFMGEVRRAFESVRAGARTGAAAWDDVRAKLGMQAVRIDGLSDRIAALPARVAERLDTAGSRLATIEGAIATRMETLEAAIDLRLAGIARVQDLRASAMRQDLAALRIAILDLHRQVEAGPPLNDVDGKAMAALARAEAAFTAEMAGQAEMPRLAEMTVRTAGTAQRLEIMLGEMKMITARLEAAITGVARDGERADAPAVLAAHERIAALAASLSRAAENTAAPDDVWAVTTDAEGGAGEGAAHGGDAEAETTGAAGDSGAEQAEASRRAAG